jgi:nitrate reductase NapAB chaperone NapD
MLRGPQDLNKGVKMIVASGFIEVERKVNIENVVDELKKRNLEINEILKTKIVFLVERETIGAVKSELDLLKEISGVKNVHLAYYSLEGAEEGSDHENNK